MRVVRGRRPDPEADREVTEALLGYVEDRDEPAFRAWRPPRLVAFGRRDASSEGYDAARTAARKHDYTPVERQVGGRAVAYTGQTVAFAYAIPVNGTGGVRSRYDRVIGLVERALRSLHVPVRSGEPAEAFCPGDHSLQNGGKIVGVAQRVRRHAALVGGCVIVKETDEEELATVLEAVYDALDVSFDPSTVGSVEGAGSGVTPDDVIESLVTTFLQGRNGEDVHVSDVRA
ncbi:MAG: lipoate--protein ligase family protein [Natronomonas sp.]